MENRVKTKDLNAIKAQLVAMQGGICPLCGGSLHGCKPINIVVDHDHGTGAIRAALHRGCNGVEGKVKQLIIGFGKTPDPRIFLKNLLAYWEHHKTPRTTWIHPTHKTPEEKRASRNALQRKRYAASKVAS